MQFIFIDGLVYYRGELPPEFIETPPGAGRWRVRRPNPEREALRGKLRNYAWEQHEKRRAAGETKDWQPPPPPTPSSC